MLLFAILAIVLVLVMCMADLPAATELTRSGVQISGVRPTAGAASQTFANNGKMYLLVENGSIASINVTVTSQSTEDDNAGSLTVQDPVVAVAAGVTKILGPWKPSLFNDADGKVTVALSAHADVTLQVVRAPNYAFGD